jgi:hypothetical protein
MVPYKLVVHIALKYPIYFSLYINCFVIMETILKMFLKFVVILAAIAGVLVGNVQGDTSCWERGEICNPPPCLRRPCCDPPLREMKP